MKSWIIKPAEMSDCIVNQWHKFQSLNPELQSPFLSPEFVRIVAETRSNINLTIFGDGNETIGFFPFRKLGSVGRPITGGADDCQAVISAPGREWDAQTVVRSSGLSVYDFTHINVSNAQFSKFHYLVRPSFIIDLSEGYDAYVQERREARKKLFSTARQMTRRLEKELGPLKFCFHDASSAAFQSLLKWKDERNKHLGIGSITSNLWLVDILDRVRRAESVHFSGVLSTVTAGEKLIAAHLGMRSATKLHYWFPTYDQACAKFSPGLILLLELCRAAAAAGIKEIELGPGHDDYKLRYSNKSTLVAAGFIGQPSLPYLNRLALYGTSAALNQFPLGPIKHYPSKVLRRLAQY